VSLPMQQMIRLDWCSVDFSGPFPRDLQSATNDNSWSLIWDGVGGVK